MFKTFLRATVTNVSIVLTLGGIALLSMSGFPLVENGRLTDFACYLMIGALAVFVVWFWRFDRRASRGDVDTSRLPRWMQDDNDPSIWMQERPRKDEGDSC